MWDVDMLILEWEDEGSEGLTAVEQFRWVFADEKIACVQQHSLEHSHHVVYTQTMEKTLDGLVVDIGKRHQIWLFKADDFS